MNVFACDVSPVLCSSHFRLFLSVPVIYPNLFKRGRVFHAYLSLSSERGARRLYNGRNEISDFHEGWQKLSA